MLSEKYQQMAKEIVHQVFPHEKTFIFGGAARKKKFSDTDIAIQGVQNPNDIFRLQEIFEESNYPTSVDIVDFDRASKSFQEYVLFHEEKIWI